jgi:hypothetical protein
MFHALEAYVNREVSPASSAIPFLNVTKAIVPLSVAHNRFRLAVKANVNFNRLNDCWLNNGSEFDLQNQEKELDKLLANTTDMTESNILTLYRKFNLLQQLLYTKDAVRLR